MDYMRPYKRLVILNLILTIIFALAFWGSIITALVIKSWTLLYIVPVIWVGGMSVVIGVRIWLSVVKARCVKREAEATLVKYWDCHIPETPQPTLTKEEQDVLDEIMSK